MIWRNKPLMAIVAAIMVIMAGCKIYSFTGASVPADVKSFSIEPFRSTANNGPAQLPQLVSEKLKIKFATEGGLRQVNADGDLVFKGTVTKYAFTAISPNAQVTAGSQRLTIAVSVNFENKKYPKETWAQAETFERYAEVSGQVTLSSVETQLIDQINKELVEDIFQKAMVKW
jgi:Lipopolysaccharide-assembly